MRARLRFRLRKGWSIPGPQFSVAGPLTPKHDQRGYYATTGIAPDLMEATRAATRGCSTTSSGATGSVVRKLTSLQRGGGS